MEGYLWKRGRKVPSMKRHYAVLKGTMLSFYLTQDEAQRSGAVPKRVLEITDLRIMPGTSSTDTNHPPHMVLKYLDADGSEPDRMAQEEIAEVQEELKRDAHRHSRAVQQATEAVEAAGRHHREQANAEAALQQNREIAVELNTQLETARTLQREALQKLQTLQHALEDARQRVHASSLGSEDSSFDQAMEAVERLAAKVEVAASAEATHGRNVELLQVQTEANSKEQQELAQRVQKCAEESKILRQVAAKSLEDAQRAKQRTKRLASWGDDTESARPSHLDPLVEGYLLCQHPMRTTMHRRYYVLTGNTLCWYADQDAFVHKMDAPSGVLHVAEVSEWDGKVKPTSPIRRLVVPFSSSPKTSSNEQYPNPFAVLTVEGKTLRCSAPLKKYQEDWIAALHVGLTMPPLSPHRARAAKSRRDSFDLLASTPVSPNQQSSDEAKKEETKTTETAAIDAASEVEELTSDVVVEGYLVGKTSLEETMKKKYCVLRALTLYAFATHQEAATVESFTTRNTFHVCGVSNWDGHATLMHYDHGFLLQTTEHQSIYCSAPSLQEKNHWVNSVQQALLRMEGYLKLKDPQKSSEKKTIKIKPLKLWKTRYCVVMGSHWLVYANQTQATSSGEAPTPVAVYELLGIAIADGDDDLSTNEFSIHVVPGRQVKCRARSSLERKRWVNAVEDELLVQAKTTEDLERSVKQHEEKLAAREAVKSKLHEVKTDARRLSALLGEAIQSAQGDSDSDCSETHGGSSEEDSTLRQRSGRDYIDGSPESSPMRRNVGETVFSFDTLDVAKDSEAQKKESPSFMSFFACFFRCIAMNSTGANGRNVIAPLGIPGYPSTAAACNPLYTCEYYEDDGYRGLAK
ncbi:hypothetical protein JG687_00012778 [Phytophthora cactorum]|uniref:PH domain-containing protein n=1 Tax=Phytophthora cactorum TaxID=29920 RepID=A0A8T1U3F4_9STRA|nr:hypothetical protein JG687_00012778 [Phytophthora cactorum]